MIVDSLQELEKMGTVCTRTDIPKLAKIFDYVVIFNNTEYVTYGRYVSISKKGIKYYFCKCRQ